MSLLKVIVLAIVQGLAELLPVSSSAHVIVAEKLMGLDPSAPEMTLLLVMLHTGTMFAVIAYFWKTWRESYFASKAVFGRFAVRLIWATVLTGVVGEGVKKLLEKTLLHGAAKAEIEQLFSHLELIAPALAAVGILILVAGIAEHRKRTAAYNANSATQTGESSITMSQSAWMGIVQGLALPFRGFSRSGSTISTGMLTGTSKAAAERFSFALAVVLTPAVVGLEVIRLWKSSQTSTIDLHASLLASLLGMVFSFLAGLLALKWLSRWLETGRWYLFGIYCLAASAVVYALHARGF
ncbi:MAG TPA: undecaprenyl-diphosphate phosphatase [Acidobacteriaceae bacterium]|jgi:undecaprenyl-diphosphatase